MKDYGELPKLVRDKIPEIAEKNNDNPEIETLEDEEILDYVTEKIVEEAIELHQSKETEELADLIEIIEKYKNIQEITQEEINKIRKQKNQEKGKFKQNYILKYTEYQK